MLNGSIFCRQTKGIPTHRMEHIVALHFFESGNNVTDGVITHVTHVKVPGRIREHFQQIVLFLVVAFCYFKGFFFFPFFLPFFLNGLGFILFFHMQISYIFIFPGR